MQKILLFNPSSIIFVYLKIKNDIEIIKNNL
jgi:hypothetical protein